MPKGRKPELELIKRKTTKGSFEILLNMIIFIFLDQWQSKIFEDHHIRPYNLCVSCVESYPHICEARVGPGFNRSLLMQVQFLPQIIDRLLASLHTFTFFTFLLFEIFKISCFCPKLLAKGYILILVQSLPHIIILILLKHIYVQLLTQTFSTEYMFIDYCFVL